MKKKLGYISFAPGEEGGDYTIFKVSTELNQDDFLEALIEQVKKVGGEKLFLPVQLGTKEESEREYEIFESGQVVKRRLNTFDVLFGVKEPDGVFIFTPFVEILKEDYENELTLLIHSHSADQYKLIFTALKDIECDPLYVDDVVEKGRYFGDKW